MRIRELRESRRISQRQLAKALDTSPQNINRYENGLVQPDYMMVKSIADYFNVSMEYLLGFSDISEPLSKVSKDILSINELHLVNFYRKLPDKIRNFLDELLIKNDIEIVIRSKDNDLQD